MRWLNGTKARIAADDLMSALPSKADACSARAHVSSGPIADMVVSTGMRLVLRNPITDPGFRQNESRVVRVIFHLLPQLTDIDTQILCVFSMRRTPHRS